MKQGVAEIQLCILDVGSRRGLMPRLLYPHGKSPQYPRPGLNTVEKINLSILSHPTNTLTELSRLEVTVKVTFSPGCR
jgi:hypothetical protein